MKGGRIERQALDFFSECTKISLSEWCDGSMKYKHSKHLIARVLKQTQKCCNFKNVSPFLLWVETFCKVVHFVISIPWCFYWKPCVWGRVMTKKTVDSLKDKHTPLGRNRPVHAWNLSRTKRHKHMQFFNAFIALQQCFKERDAGIFQLSFFSGIAICRLRKRRAVKSIMLFLSFGHFHIKSEASEWVPGQWRESFTVAYIFFIPELIKKTFSPSNRIWC